MDNPYVCLKHCPVSMRHTACSTTSVKSDSSIRCQGAENARLKNTGLENAASNCRTEICGSWTVWNTKYIISTEIQVLTMFVLLY